VRLERRGVVWTGTGDRWWGGATDRGLDGRAVGRRGGGGAAAGLAAKAYDAAGGSRSRAFPKHTVAPAQAGAYPVCQSKPKGAIGSGLRWSDAGWSGATWGGLDGVLS
jgi:hypothetical protein